MFTEQPSLAQRIERVIRDTPIIDPYSHIRPDQPGTKNLAGLISNHRVMNGLRAVGMPPGDAASRASDEGWVIGVIPYLARMRNTATYWSLFRIFRDLYDFHDPVLTESNVGELFAAVEARGQEPTWAASVLRDKCKIQALVTSLPQQGDGGTLASDSVYYRLDDEFLFGPTEEESATVALGDYDDALADLLGGLPSTPAALGTAIKDYLDRTVTGRVRFTSMLMPIDRDYVRSVIASPVAALNKRVAGEVPEDDEQEGLFHFAALKALEWHHDHGKALQVRVGSEDHGDGFGISCYRPRWATGLAGLARKFDKARFNLLVSSDLLGQEVATLAAQRPNISVSGYWAHGFSPPLIEKEISLRLLVAPMTKWVGFLSDAGSVEWTYGNLQVVKKAMARAFESHIQAGYYEEDEAPAILKQILHDTPKAIFELG